MSVAKIERVKAARKAQGPCGKCKTEIKVGDGYLHYTIGFRSNYKRVRCLKPECFPKPSERESTSKSGPMSVCEDFESSTYETIEDLNSAWEEVQSAFREYADECEEALSAWENGNYMLEERRDQAEEAANEVESNEAEDFGEDEPELESWGDDPEDEPDREPGESEDEFNERHAEWESNHEEAFTEAHTEWENDLEEHVGDEHQRLIDVANEAQGMWA